MLIKAPDDKQPLIDALRSLLTRPDVGAYKRREIEDEIRNVRAGARAEKDAAYEIEFEFARSRNIGTIHDLRVEQDGRVAQIDHLIVNRFMHVWVVESKSVSEGSVIEIDEYGEWSRAHGRQRIGIGSPIRQNTKHIAVLRELFAGGPAKVPSRLGVPLVPTFHSIVLISNSGRIKRPRAAVEGLDAVIKVDRLIAMIDKTIDGISLAEIVRLIGSDALEDFARRVAARHSPIQVDWPGRFGLPKVPPELAPVISIGRSTPEAARSSGVAQADDVCASCGNGVTPKVAAYCRASPARFANKILCYKCQRTAARSG